MTTPYAGEVKAEPEFNSAIWTVNSTPSQRSGPVSPGAGRRSTRCRIAHSETKMTPSSIRQKALHNGGTESTPTRIETTLPPQSIETRRARQALEKPIGWKDLEDKLLFS